MEDQKKVLVATVHELWKSNEAWLDRQPSFIRGLVEKNIGKEVTDFLYASRENALLVASGTNGTHRTKAYVVLVHHWGVDEQLLSMLRKFAADSKEDGELRNLALATWKKHLKSEEREQFIEFLNLLKDTPDEPRPIQKTAILMLKLLAQPPRPKETVKDFASLKSLLDAMAADYAIIQEYHTSD